jgi:hypothetical protein
VGEVTLKDILERSTQRKSITLAQPKPTKHSLRPY